MQVFNICVPSGGPRLNNEPLGDTPGPDYSGKMKRGVGEAVGGGGDAMGVGGKKGIHGGQVGGCHSTPDRSNIKEGCLWAHRSRGLEPEASCPYWNRGRQLTFSFLFHPGSQPREQCLPGTPRKLFPRAILVLSDYGYRSSHVHIQTEGQARP